MAQRIHTTPKTEHETLHHNKNAFLFFWITNMSHEYKSEGVRRKFVTQSVETQIILIRQVQRKIYKSKKLEMRRRYEKPINGEWRAIYSISVNKYSFGKWFKPSTSEYTIRLNQRRDVHTKESYTQHEPNNIYSTKKYTYRLRNKEIQNTNTHTCIQKPITHNDTNTGTRDTHAHTQRFIERTRNSKRQTNTTHERTKSTTIQKYTHTQITPHWVKNENDIANTQS